MAAAGDDPRDAVEAGEAIDQETFGVVVELEQAAIALQVVWALTNFGAIFERRRWVVASELTRLITAIGVAALFTFSTPWFAPAVLGATVAAGLLSGWLFKSRDRFAVAPHSLTLSTSSSG